MGSSSVSLPSVTLPKAGGSIKGMGEKFSVNPATGTGSFTIPIAASSGRNGNGVQLGLSYDSGNGNGPFGMGWSLSMSSIRRKTDKGIPRYFDDEESDVFIISGAEDLVPVLEWDATLKVFGGRKMEVRKEGGRTYRTFTYQPRIEGSFQRILRLVDTETGEVHWEVKTPENSTMIYGDSDNSRIFNPESPSQVFEWLPSRTFDQVGNLIVFEYKPENSEGISMGRPHEEQRTPLSRSAYRYLKSVKYGNTVSLLSPNFAGGTDWHFEVVFDYGDHDNLSPTPAESCPWPARQDPFSSYRSGFEIRQYRLCRRVLMFHHFPDEPNIGRNCAVAAFNLSYKTVGMDEKTKLSITTVVESVIQESWRRSKTGYDRDALPPIDFTYSESKLAEVPRDLESEYLTNLPIGFNDTSYQLIDLEGQGLAGAVSKTEGGLIYMPNSGEGKFGAAEILLRVPGALFSRDTSSWMDLSGDGKMELVKFDGPTPGFYCRDWDEESGWDSFRTFEQLPNISWGDRNVKYIDVTGDGLTDVLILDDNLLCVYRGWGRSGFGDPLYISPPLDEDQGSRLLFWDGVEMLYTTDMTGDGLSDLVRIRQSEVAYWPNEGYGRFGKKVIMDHPPDFDFSSQFDQSLLKLSDVDGSGTTDIIYLGGSTPMIYFNLSGNGWSEGTPIHGFPSINSITNVEVADLFGRGTGCLVWSSSLPGDFGRQVRYLDLMEQGKPYLLTKMENNNGLESRLTYTSSSLFYARDKKAGRHWISHLTFPVQCVEMSETVDRVSGNVFTTRYAYHDGYFDGPEREFRGFGMVESWDTEHYSSIDISEGHYSNIDKVSNIPPVLTRTWFSTGQFQQDVNPTQYFSHEYYHDLNLHPDLSAIQLSGTTLPTSIQLPYGPIPYTASYQEQREAYRALKGSTLRSEVYSVDGTDLENIPVTVTEANFVIEQRQPLGNNRHTVFLVYAKESVSMLYDRKLYHVGSEKRFDPRVEHSVTLEVDFFGNPLKSVAINYGRRYDDSNPNLTAADRERQRYTYAMMSEMSYTNMIDTTAAYVLPTIAESSSYEIINIMTAATNRDPDSRWIGIEAVRRAVKTLSSGEFDVPFENIAGPYPFTTRPCRRMIKRRKCLFKKDDLSGPLPLGVIEPMMLPWKNHDLAFTDEQVSTYVQSGKSNLVETETLIRSEGAYLRFPGERGWWSDSGQAFYSPTRGDSPEEELRYAREHFYFFYRSRTPWDTDANPAESTYTYEKYNLLVQSVTDPYGNIVSVGERDKDPLKPLLRPGYDYRLMVPFIQMDTNRNRTEVSFDVLGYVVANAIRGKPEDNDGDIVAGVKTELSEKDIKSFFQSPLIHASALLGTATSRAVYDLYAYRRTKHLDHPQPNWSSSITRETNVSDLQDGAESRVFVGFSYADGTGRPIQAKAQCEPGPLEPGDALETKNEDEVIVHNRWITSSWVIYNNKGDPVRNYEPFFADNHVFQDKAIYGVSTLFIYDALSRGVAVINADHSWTKVVFTPWNSESWDKSDTVLNSNPATDTDVGAFVKKFPEHDYMPTWYEQRRKGQLGSEEEAAAMASAAIANTPSKSYMDAMGRECVKFETLCSAIQGSKAIKDKILRQASFVDIEGLPWKVVDTLGRTGSVMTYTIGKVPIKEVLMDAGEKWTLKAVDGALLRTWNGRNQVFRPVYDKIRRVYQLHLQDGVHEHLIEKTEFGDLLPDGEANNSRNRIVESSDQSEVTWTPIYDYKGNLVKSTRKLAKSVQGILDWKGNVDLEVQSYEEVMKSNALNKVTMTRLPDGTVTLYTYNDRGMQQTVTTILASDKTKQQAIKEIEYDAKGQRTKVLQGNGVVTRVSYDKFTFAVRRIVTTRRPQKRASSSGGDSDSSSSSSAGRSPRRRRVERLQDMQYTYDVAGNITHVEDVAKEPVFFRNHRISPSQSFQYDSLYRLVEATGREHVGQMACAKDGNMFPGQSGPLNEASGDHPHNGEALARYIEKYDYDSQGNILSLQHATPSESRSWTRLYEYNEPSAVISSEKNNRLSRTRVGHRTEEYSYEGPSGITGSMTSMPRLPLLGYDYGDKMVSSSSQASGKEEACREQTFYRYDSTGKRVRKTTERKNPDGSMTLVKETIYIGGAFEVFRRFSGRGDVTLEIHSLSIAESGRRLLLIDNRIVGNDTRSPATVYRYQLANHQGSATMEVDQDANILTYEEYTPYGVSALRAMVKQTEVPKRYRFIGKEQDDSGLYAFGVRYYAAWLGRFTSADPKGAADGLNQYQYAQSNPTMLKDPDGTQAGPVDQALGWGEKVLQYRRNLAAQAWNNLKNASWRTRLGINNNIFGDRAAQDFARMLQNKKGALATAADFEMPFAGRKTIADFVFQETGEVWEHKLISPGRFLMKVGEWRKGGQAKFVEVMESWGTQLSTAAQNVGAAPQLGVTIKKVEEGGKQMEQFMAKVKEALPSSLNIEFVHEMAPPLAHAREELNLAAKATMNPMTRELLLSGAKFAKAAAPVAKAIGKVAGPLVVLAAVLGTASDAFAAGTGHDALGEPANKSASEKTQTALDVGSALMGGALKVAGKQAVRTALGAGAEVAAATAAAAAGGAATGALVGSWVDNALEKPLQEKLGDADGAGVAAGTGVLAGAAAGAAVGAVIGSVVPGLGTAAGAAIGGIAGAAGAGAKILISKYWG